MTRITTHPNEVAAKVKPCADTPNTAQRRSRYFGTTPRFRLNHQRNHTLSQEALGGGP